MKMTIARPHATVVELSAWFAKLHIVVVSAGSSDTEVRGLGKPCTQGLELCRGSAPATRSACSRRSGHAVRHADRVRDALTQGSPGFVHGGTVIPGVGTCTAGA